MKEESKRIVEGLKHCAEKYTRCKGCPVRGDCEEFEAAGRSYVPIKALQVSNELEEMLKEYRVYIFKATVAALKGTLDEEGEGDGERCCLSKRIKCSQSTRRASDGAII